MNELVFTLAWASAAKPDLVARMLDMLTKYIQGLVAKKRLGNNERRNVQFDRERLTANDWGLDT